MKKGLKNNPQKTQTQTEVEEKKEEVVYKKENWIIKKAKHPYFIGWIFIIIFYLVVTYTPIGQIQITEAQQGIELPTPEATLSPDEIWPSEYPIGIPTNESNQ